MKHTGACLCGAVSYEVAGDMRPVLACHCSQCRKTSGHIWASSQIDDHQLALINRDGLRWYRSSETAERGFCQFCGSSVFWRLDGEGRISIAAGTLNLPTGLSMAEHIFVADKGDYYEIEPGPPQSP
ncbi:MULTISPECIES: GFA family protein [Thioclava]|uniref:GFA family protein n=1 Tax=Thioclava TaxID=285107 RepID=UPI000C587F0B|nr:MULTISPECIES: GFA family protein [Thioclava]MAQ38679.1 aldehyde-activating protein [Thioclava sp.]|tara:strand:+ start:5013 stop:5393 length:381 start_codon:yes stop_codon:yes gene_type:complete